MDVIAKPPFGSPCNGCGGCCQQSLCPISEAFFGQEDGPCPALEPTAGAYRCGLMASPHAYAPVQTARHGAAAMAAAVALWVGAGMGCDAQEAGEIVDPAVKSAMRARCEANAEALGKQAFADALEKWGILDQWQSC